MRPSLRSLFEQIVNSPIEQSEEHSSSNEENDNNGSVKSVGHVPGNLAAMVRTQKKNMTVDTKDKSQTSSKPKKPDSKAQTTPPGNINSLKKRNKRKNSEKERKKETPSPKDVGPSKFTETFGECIKIKTAYDTAQKSTSESQQRHKSTKSTQEDYKQSKTYPKAKHQKQQPEFGKSNFHHQDKSECRVSKASKSHPEPRPPMESSQQSLFSTEVPKKISKPARSDVIMSSNPASPVLIDGDEFSTESESENPAVRPGKKILKEKKRIRNRKFTFHENLVLIENLVPHFHKLLGNRAAATESAWKNTIWKQIADAVTSVGVSPRSADNVRKRYQDIRLLLRRKISDENKSR
ncbi:U2 snRNP-associated SURP motif-containing protein-like [Rana temporaria]|nr:U2 snRNP-associated SURP motif-containing protein-like [Rana temporaria]